MRNIDIVKLICKYFNENRGVDNFDYEFVIIRVPADSYSSV